MRVKRHRRDKKVEVTKVAVRHETVTKGKAVAYLKSFICLTIQPFLSLANYVQHLKAFKYCLYKHKNAFSMIR